MANNNEVQTKKSSSKSIPDDSKKSTPHVEKKPSVTLTSSPTFVLIFSILALATAAIAIVCSIYALKANLQLVAKTTQKTQLLSTEFSSLKAQQQEAQSLETDIKTLNQSQIQLQDHIKALDNALKIALQQRLYQKQDWILLKARYYLELAQINAHWSDDQQTTIALLQQADTLLAALSYQQVLTIRQAIAQEIAQLQVLPKVDVAGLLSQLDAAKNNLSNLPLKKPISHPQSHDTNGKTSSEWRDQLRDSINSLGKLVVIRRHEENVEPLLSPLQQAMLQEVIRLNLEEAQWAILQNNSSVYQLALTQAINAIKRTFDETASSTQALIKQLQALQQQKLNLAKPVIGKALPLLNQLIDNKNLQSHTPASKEGEQLP
ncbi:uroporphyrinogen-III C-methyltransferase [Legionella brunensis]|uniref:Uroporphyrinogen III methylase n=1 Tax=Legionella brunensis TaxID=29422 RepID=A0A0W0SNZ2_9GAMM|nr:uroporphyrinogen-III C-methyltransferase [Legionella brunensis]KTC85106.1 uroporphyrinogen III methylase [Legionella brunensis]